MIKNKNGGKKKELLAEDRRKMQRLAGILKESMFFEEAPPEEEEPLPGGDDMGAPAPDMGGDDLGMDDGGDDLGMDDGGDVPAGPEGVQSPEVEEMVNLFRDFLVAQQESLENLSNASPPTSRRGRQIYPEKIVSTPDPHGRRHENRSYWIQAVE